MSYVNKKTVLSLFIAQYFELIVFLKNKSPTIDNDFSTFIKKCNIIRKTNPKLFIRTWYNQINKNYYNQIIQKDSTFFLNKTYISSDNSVSPQYTNMVSKKCKHVFVNMENDNQQLLWNKLTQLCELTSLYFDEIRI